MKPFSVSLYSSTLDLLTNTTGDWELVYSRGWRAVESDRDTTETILLTETYSH